MNEKLILDGDLVDGYIHGKAKFKINYHTVFFGIYNNLISIPEFADEDSDTDERI